MAKIIPGVSGAVLAISFGVYERLLSIMGNPLKIRFNDLRFLLFLFLGIGIGILAFCICIKWCLDYFYFPTMLMFIGLIIGGFSEITSEIRNYKLYNLIIFILSFLFVLLITNLSGGNGSSTNFFLMGSIESLTTIIPGISGTAIFMALGWYESLLNVIHGILTFSSSLTVSFSFIGGFICATIVISNVLVFLLQKYKIQTYYSILGFMCASVWEMLCDVFKNSFNFTDFILGIFLLTLGILSTKIINSFFENF